MDSMLVRWACVVMALQTATVAQSGWTQVATTGPSGRHTPAMAFDSQRGLTVLFGGDDHFISQADTWVWDGTNWSQRIVAGPSARARSAMAFDSIRGRVVLFGGSQSPPAALNDTWEWTGTVWQAQLFASGPAARHSHAMAYDSQRGRVVMFSGVTPGNVPLGDTWEWDGTSWTQRQVAGPPARISTAMAYDFHRARTVLFGGWVAAGALGSFFGDTWEWNGSAWTQVSSGETPRSSHAMVYDSHRRLTLMTGGWNGTILGTTATWNGTSWSSSGSGPQRYEHGMAYDSNRARTVVFGGLIYLGDTWELASGTPSIAAVYGAGCGNPALALTPAALPTIGTTARATLTNVPASLAFVALGWSRTAFGPYPLPLGLGGYGLTGCDLLQSAEAAAQPVAFTGAGTANYNLPLPNLSGLIGLRVYLQGWAYAPGVNVASTIVSNAIEWTVGL